MSEDLFQAAKAASAKAHAPYSKFFVGAAIRTPDGAIHAGCNIENVSYPEGWCAETSAIAHMIMAGERTIAEIAVYSPNMPACTPCGGCRQRIAEFAGAETPVHLCDDTGIVQTLALKDLLPASFDMEND